MPESVQSSHYKRVCRSKIGAWSRRSLSAIKLLRDEGTVENVRTFHVEPKFAADIQRWKKAITQNKQRALALYENRHRETGPALPEVRSQVSFLRPQADRLEKFIRDIEEGALTSHWRVGGICKICKLR